MNKDDCIFCQIISGEKESWKIYESKSALAFFDASPINEYHTLVVPKDHSTNLFDTSADQLSEIMLVVKNVVDLFSENLGVENVQVINSSGVHAQQDVHHLHFHVIPRYEGDGKDIKMETHSEMRAKFDELIARLSKQ